MDPPFAEALYAAHRPALFRFLRRMTGDPATAEELTQDVFVRALRGLPGYERRERDRAWLFRIARRLLMDARRSRARRPVESPEPDDTALAWPSAAPHVALDLDAALASLPRQDRECFLLREQGGLSYGAGRRGGIGDGGRKHLTVRAGETVALVLPPPSGQQLQRTSEDSGSVTSRPGEGPFSPDGTSITPTGVTVDFGRFFAGHTMSVRLTARPL